MAKLIIFCVSAYLLGSISISYIIGKTKAKIDIREHGSGNAGATNATRVLGAKAGLLTLIFDFLKGFLPVFILMRTVYVENTVLALVVGVFVILGHDYSLMLNFKGGKGVATSVAVAMAYDPRIGLAAVALFIIIFALFKYVSLASILTAAIMVAFLVYSYFFMHGEISALIMASYATLLIVRHHSNIKKLLKGEEDKFSLKKGD